jgi:hypothetical protein
MRALPIDKDVKMLYISVNTPPPPPKKKPPIPNLNGLNTFTKETGSHNVKLVLIR